MKGMVLKNLNSDIQSGNFKSLYLLYGDENYLLKSYKETFKKTLSGDNEFNYEYFEGKHTDIDRFIDAVNTVPFMADKRCIIAEDTGWFKSSPDKLVEFITKIPQSSVVVFIDREVDKRGRLYKKAADAGYIAELNSLDAVSLKKWAAGILAKNGKKITVSDMDLFLNYTGSDMERIKNELEKLTAYIGDEEVIKRSDIENIVTVNIEGRVFKMIEALASKRINETMGLYKDLLALKEEPRKIFPLIVRQFNWLLIIKEALNEGGDIDKVAKVFQIPQFLVLKLKKQAKGFETAELEKYLKRCIEIEESMKTGDIPDRLAVELMIAVQ